MNIIVGLVTLECIVALELLNTNFFTICIQIASRDLSIKLDFSQDACLCVYMVNKGYAEYSIKDNKFDIYFSNDDILESNNIFYSNIEKNNKHIYSLSSRTMAIIKRNANLYSCYHELYNFIKNINGNLFVEKRYL